MFFSQSFAIILCREFGWITPNSRHWWPEGTRPNDGQCWPIKYSSLWVWIFSPTPKSSGFETKQLNLIAQKLLLDFFSIWSSGPRNSGTRKRFIKIVWHTNCTSTWRRGALDMEKFNVSLRRWGVPQGNEPCGSQAQTRTITTQPLFCRIWGRVA